MRMNSESRLSGVEESLLQLVREIDQVKTFVAVRRGDKPAAGR